MEGEFRLTRRRFLRAAGIISAAEACKPLNLPEPTPKRKPEVPGISDLDFPITGDMYLLNGPHYIGTQDKKRYALDLYSPNEFARVVAAKWGKVIYAGEVMEDGKINDTLHSIVEIDVGAGYRLQYVHVGNIRVRPGQTVDRGHILGEQSLEVPAPYVNEEGEKIVPTTSVIHLHFGIKRNGQPIDLDGESIADWKIRKGIRPGEGTMTKENPYFGEKYIVTANPNFCGPSEESIRACGGITNYIPHPGFVGNR